MHLCQWFHHFKQGQGNRAVYLSSPVENDSPKVESAEIQWPPFHTPVHQSAAQPLYLPHEVIPADFKPPGCLTKLSIAAPYILSMPSDFNPHSSDNTTQDAVVGKLHHEKKTSRTFSIFRRPFYNQLASSGSIYFHCSSLCGGLWPSDCAGMGLPLLWAEPRAFRHPNRTTISKLVPNQDMPLPGQIHGIIFQVV